MVFDVVQIEANMEAIKKALQNGPISGAVYATDHHFRMHHGPGIIDKCEND
jgi:hypothetical protein